MRLSRFIFSTESTTLSEASNTTGGQDIVQSTTEDDADGSPLEGAKKDPIRCFVQAYGGTSGDAEPYGNYNIHQVGQENTALVTAITSSISAYITGSIQNDYVFLIETDYS